MATISIDYDPNGDVELVLQHSDEDESRTYNMGLIGVKVKEVRLRVSSLRLVASSRHFKAMLDFQEGKELKQHGSVEIELCDPEDDPTAMAIILSILHEKEVYLPIDMDLPLLFKVTVLVDKYHWHDMVTPYATLWFDSLVDSLGLPEDFDDNLLTWLWMSWVFGLKEYFKTLSRVAMQDACSSIDTTNENIRLLTRALNAINDQRERGFKEIEDTIEATKEKFITQPVAGAHHEFDEIHKLLKCMVYGVTVFHSRDLGLGEFAAADHAGSSIRSLKRSINSLQSMKGIKIRVGHGQSIIHPGHPWEVVDDLKKGIDDLKMDEWGLDYDDFKPPSTKDRQTGLPEMKEGIFSFRC